MEKQNSSLIYSISNLLNMFLRANFSGPVPSVHYILKESKALLQETIFSDLRDTSNVKFEIDSEHPMPTIRSSDTLNYFYLFQSRIDSLNINSVLDLDLLLIRLRCLNVVQASLPALVPSIRLSIIKIISELEKMSGSFSTTFPECETGTCLRVRLASLYMECAQLLQLFSELRSAGRAIEAARVLLGVDVRFDAVVGRRMRYQDFKPLLVVRALVSTAAPPLADTDQSGSGEPNAESPSNVPHIEALLDVLDDTDTDAYTSDAVTGAGASSAADSRMRPEFARWLSESHVLAADEQQVATAASAQMPRDLALDDDALLPKTELQAGSGASNVELPHLSHVQLLVLLLAEQHRRLHARDEILIEQLLAFANFVLEKPSSWLVQTEALRIRSQFEDNRSRRFERSFLQLQELVQQLDREEEAALADARLAHAFGLPLRRLAHAALEEELAALMVRNEMYQSALEVYVPHERWSCVIDCYRRLQEPQRAEQVIRERLAVCETPELLCALGEVTRDESCLQRAWERSGRRHARAMTALALTCLNRGLLERAAECFEQALAVNPLVASCWFTLGCVRLQQRSFGAAVAAFRRSATLEPDNFQAWANLATALVQTKQKKKAFRILKEAIKANYEEWRVWENYVFLALDCGEFKEALHGIHRLLDLKHKFSDKQVLELLVRAVNEDLVDAGRKAGASSLRAQLKELFGRITSQIFFCSFLTRVTAQVSNEPHVWQSYAALLAHELRAADASGEAAALTLRPLAERFTDYCQRAVRLHLNAANWEADGARRAELLAALAALLEAHVLAARVTVASGQREAARGFALQVNGVLRRLCAHRDSLLAPEAAAETAARASSASACVSLDAAIARLERTRALLQLEHSDGQSASEGASELSAALVALTTAE